MKISFCNLFSMCPLNWYSFFQARGCLGHLGVRFLQRLCFGFLLGIHFLLHPCQLVNHVLPQR